MVNAIPVIDLEHLYRQTFGDTALRNDVLGLFLSQSKALIAEGRADPSALGRVAHKLSGSARGIGVARVAEMATAVEALDPDARKDAFARLAACVDEANAAIEALLAS